MNRLGVREPNDWRGVKTRADHETLGEMLMIRFRGEDGRTVVGRGPRGVAAMPDEIVLGFGCVRALVVALCGGEDLGPFAVEVDQLLRNRLPFRRVAVQKLRSAALAQDGSKLPSEIEGVLHRDVHALARLRAVGVAGVAGDEYPRQTFRDVVFRHVVELVAKPLADLIDRPPRNLFHVERIGLENAPRSRDQVIGREVAIGNPLAGIELVELDI